MNRQTAAARPRRQKAAAAPRRRKAETPQPEAAAQPPANPERGEHELTLSSIGVTYRLRPSHTAIRAIEKETGIALIPLANLGNVGGYSLEQLGIIAKHLVRAGADEKDELTRHVSAEKLEELIYEEGTFHAVAAFTLCLRDAARGGRTASGEAKAAVVI